MIIKLFISCVLSDLKSDIQIVSIFFNTAYCILCYVMLGLCKMRSTKLEESQSLSCGHCRLSIVLGPVLQ